MTQVGVLGGGPWGLSLARAARRAGAEVTLLSRRHRAAKWDVGGIRLTTDIEELAESRLIILAVPSIHVKSIGRELGDHIDGGHVLVHGIRGLIGEDVRAVSHVLREETPARRLGALGGPVQAAELNDGRPSAMVVGSEFSDVRRAVRQALQSEWLQVHEEADMRGVEWASALVGCLSIGVGFAQARADVSPGLLAALISRAVDEAAAIAAAAGANERTLYGLAGYGDLLASMALPDRPEVVLGRELGAGATLEEAQQKAALRVEAVELVPRVVAYAHMRGVGCAIFTALGNIIQGQGEPEQIVRALFSR